MFLKREKHFVMNLFFINFFIMIGKDWVFGREKRFLREKH